MYPARLSALLIVMALGSVLLVACPINDDEPDVEREPVDAATTPDRVESHIRALHAASRASTGWVEETQVFEETIFPLFAISDEESEEELEGFLIFLEDYVFVDEHVEQETSTEVVYLLQGERICEGIDAELGGRDIRREFDLQQGFFQDLNAFNSIGDFEGSDGLNGLDGLDEPEEVPVPGEPANDELAREECAQIVDNAEVRLHLTSPLPDQYAIATRLGSEGDNPVTFTVASDMSAIVIDFEAIGESLEHLAAMPDDEELEEQLGFDPGQGVEESPTTMEGTMMWNFEVEAANRTNSRLSIVDSIMIDDEMFRFVAEATEQVYERQADGGAEIMETTLNWGRIEFHFPVNNEESDELEGRFIFDGLAMQTLLTSQRDDEIRTTGLSINEPIALIIEDETIFSIDWGSLEGESVDATINIAEDLEMSLSPSLYLTLNFELGEEAPPMDLTRWMASDTWTITLDGSVSPTVVFRESGVLEIAEGTLRLTSPQTDTILEVESGECLIPGQQPPQDPFRQPDDVGPFEDQPAEAPPPTFHPFDLFGIIPC